MPGTGSTVNFGEGKVVGNSTNITLCRSDNCEGDFKILSRNTNSHVLVDVLGYFYPASNGVAFVDGQTSLPFGAFSDVAALNIEVGGDGYVIVNFNAKVQSDANVATLCGLALNGIPVKEDIARTSFSTASEHMISFVWGAPVQRGDVAITARCRRDSSGTNPTLSNAALTATFSGNQLTAN